MQIIGRHRQRPEVLLELKRQGRIAQVPGQNFVHIFDRGEPIGVKMITAEASAACAQF